MHRERSEPRRVAVVFGTRPEAVKLAPVIHALASCPNLRARVVITAQHRAMLDPILDFFGILPDHDLDILQEGQTLADVMTRGLSGVSAFLQRERPDMVLVQGDTTTTLAGALAGFYERVPVAHLEAGLRTHDFYAPYPEEMNRRLTTQLSTLHLAPTGVALNNLLNDGVPRTQISVTGNTVIDALLWATQQQVTYADPALKNIDGDGRRVIVVTAHRRESWGDRIKAIGHAIAELAATDPGILIVFPIHRNRLVREAILPSLSGIDNVLITEPMAYGEFTRLLRRSDLILTDSGGLQEEGPALGKPVFVMRDVTERPEAITAGTAMLVGTCAEGIVSAIRGVLSDSALYARMATAANPFGDGRAAARCVAAIASRFGFGLPPEEFSYTPPEQAVNDSRLTRA